MTSTPRPEPTLSMQRPCSTRDEMSSNTKKPKSTGTKPCNPKAKPKSNNKDKASNPPLWMNGERASLIETFKSTNYITDFADHSEWLKALWQYLHEHDSQIQFEHLVSWDNQNDWISTFWEGEVRTREPWTRQLRVAAPPNDGLGTQDCQEIVNSLWGGPSFSMDVFATKIKTEQNVGEETAADEPNLTSNPFYSQLESPATIRRRRVESFLVDQILDLQDEQNERMRRNSSLPATTTNMATSVTTNITEALALANRTMEPVAAIPVQNHAINEQPSEILGLPSHFDPEEPMVGTSASFYPVLQPMKENICGNNASINQEKDPLLVEAQEGEEPDVSILSDLDDGAQRMAGPEPNLVSGTRNCRANESETRVHQHDEKEIELAMTAIRSLVEVRDICKTLHISSGLAQLEALCNVIQRFIKNNLTGKLDFAQYEEGIVKQEVEDDPDENLDCWS